MTNPVNQIIDYIDAPLRRPLPDTAEWYAELPGELLTPVDVGEAVQKANLARIASVTELQDGSVKFVRTDGATLSLALRESDAVVAGEAVVEATLATTTAAGAANEPEIANNYFHDGDDVGEEFLRYVISQIVDWAEE